MSKFDSFDRDLNKCKNIEGDLQDLLNERKKKPSGRIDNMIKAKMDVLNTELQNMNRNLVSATEDPFKYGLTDKQVQKRREKLDAIIQNARVMETAIELGGTPKGSTDTINHSQNDDEEQNLLGDDGEYTQTRGKDNKQVLEVGKKKLLDQDKYFDEVSKVAVGMKEDGKMIAQELDYQNDMLDDLNRGMDKTGMKMMRVDGKLKKLISESNQ